MLPEYTEENDVLFLEKETLWVHISGKPRPYVRQLGPADRRQDGVHTMCTNATAGAVAD
jgi:hypothetical protein